MCVEREVEGVQPPPAGVVLGEGKGQGPTARSSAMPPVLYYQMHAWLCVCVSVISQAMRRHTATVTHSQRAKQTRGSNPSPSRTRMGRGFGFCRMQSSSRRLARCFDRIAWLGRDRSKAGLAFLWGSQSVGGAAGVVDGFVGGAAAAGGGNRCLKSARAVRRRRRRPSATTTTACRGASITKIPSLLLAVNRFMAGWGRRCHRLID